MYIKPLEVLKFYTGKSESNEQEWSTTQSDARRTKVVAHTKGRQQVTPVEQAK